MLGETYEFENDDIQCISEKVRHNPITLANFCRGKKSKYTAWNNQQTSTKFRVTTASMDMIEKFDSFINFEEF